MTVGSRGQEVFSDGGRGFRRTIHPPNRWPAAPPTPGQRHDWLIEWKQGAKPCPWLTARQWAQLPATLTLRAVQGSLYQQGFRVRQVTVVTAKPRSHRP